MPSGELKINGLDAYDTYGLSLSDGGKAELMTPPANKGRAFNTSRLRNGKESVGSPERVDSREVSLPMHITAPTSEVGLARYAAFCSVLRGGTVDIMYKGLPTEEFHCKYVNCSNFTEFRNMIMRFTLRLDEPNPANRTITEGREWA